MALRKLRKIIIILVLMLVAVLVALTNIDTISFLLAGDKPSRILFNYPSKFYSEDIEKRLIPNSQFGDYYFYLDDDNNVMINQLLRYDTFNYQFTDCVGTIYDGHSGVIGESGYMPTKTVSFTGEGNEYQVTCKRAITSNISIEGDEVVTTYDSITVCEISDDVDFIYKGKATDKHYAPIYSELTDGKTISIFRIDIEDMLHIDDIEGDSFKVVYYD